MALYPLGTVIEIIESIPAMNVSHMHEDLVFFEHNAFLLQFTTRQDEIFIHINTEAEISEIKESILALKKAAAKENITILDGDYYRLKQADKENITIEFMKQE